MRSKFFIDYWFDEAIGAFFLIGVWMHNPNDSDVDIFSLDESSSEVDERMWVINRLFESELKTPEDFLDFHQQRAGYRGMQRPMKDTDTQFNFKEIRGQFLNASR